MATSLFLDWIAGRR